ncbi:uncharacterized protein BDZ99DRAFT_7129 [Mytilinidion resinicola]|uniref:Uncharacterized protein n=1 Tax=Mytilinidion resinicola TaxID=574789 RepID=A0A6A6Z9P9_9PEZI|nr:uncharacterized protein BDZ99DRAFT_7129 [Mytilinidion resinicola]KAF2817004.1 hypothetical protein BDZ99DRAFT_7129 [Mytilinidion resinicola]
MMQIAGRFDSSLFNPLRPPLDAAVLVLEAWMIFGQKAEGTVHLRRYILSHLYAEPVEVYDIKVIWEHFDHDSDVVEAMISNVVENWVGGEFSDIEKLIIKHYVHGKKELEERICQAKVESQKKIEAREANPHRRLELNDEVHPQQLMSALAEDTHEGYFISQSRRLSLSQSHSESDCEPFQ